MEKEELVENLMQTLKEKLDGMADSNKGLNKKINLCFEDIDTGYLVHIGEDGTVQQFDKKSLEEAKASPSDVAIYMTVDVIDGIMKKEINPMMALMQGKIRIEGDMSVATKIASVFM